MRTYIIVLLYEVRNIPPEFFGAVICINVNLFRLERAEPPLNHDVVRLTGIVVHTLTNMLAFKIRFIFFAGKLAALVRSFLFGIKFRDGQSDFSKAPLKIIPFDSKLANGFQHLIVPFLQRGLLSSGVLFCFGSTLKHAGRLF